jgi:hypothetical protein
MAQTRRPVLAISANTRDARLGVELGFRGERAKQHFAELTAWKTDIENKLVHKRID